MSREGVWNPPQDLEALVKSLMEVVNAQADQIKRMQSQHEQLFNNQKNLLRMVLDVKKKQDDRLKSPIITLR